MDFKTKYKEWTLGLVIVITLSIPLILIFIWSIDDLEDLQALITISCLFLLLFIGILLTGIKDFKKLILTDQEILIQYIILRKNISIEYKNIFGYKPYMNGRGISLVLINIKKEITVMESAIKNFQELKSELEKRGVKELN